MGVDGTPILVNTHRVQAPTTVSAHPTPGTLLNPLDCANGLGGQPHRIAGAEWHGWPTQSRCRATGCGQPAPGQPLRMRVRRILNILLNRGRQTDHDAVWFSLPGTSRPPTETGERPHKEAHTMRTLLTIAPTLIAIVLVIVGLSAIAGAIGSVTL